jgi:hypothetical protein
MIIITVDEEVGGCDPRPSSWVLATWDMYSYIKLGTGQCSG